MKALALAITSWLLVSCALVATPAQTISAFPPVLNLENRGGPTFVVSVGGVEVARVRCNEGAAPVVAGQDGVADLPWALSVVRLGDGQVVLRSNVTELPMWLVQIGDEIGIGSVAVAGPPGPTCPAELDLLDPKISLSDDLGTRVVRDAEGQAIPSR
jgi:hypothetical protein